MRNLTISVVVCLSLPNVINKVMKAFIDIDGLAKPYTDFTFSSAGALRPIWGRNEHYVPKMNLPLRLGGGLFYITPNQDGKCNSLYGGLKHCKFGNVGWSYCGTGLEALVEGLPMSFDVPFGSIYMTERR
ncbi:hypothetical protein GOBAR_DD01307 [Gossypium barbadense]|nr:hypothetical protein GOBAR_DD01307 [Gossypium barbadense]